MMMASMMGAIAFQKDLGAVHSCAHALGAVCDMHHGLANALMIDTVMAWNQQAVGAKFDELAHVCRVSGGGGSLCLGCASSSAPSASPAHCRAMASGLSTWTRWSASPTPTDAIRPIPGPAPRPILSACSARRCERGSAMSDSRQKTVGQRLKIGVSACFFTPTPPAPFLPARPCITWRSRWPTGLCRRAIWR